MAENKQPRKTIHLCGPYAGCPTVEVYDDKFVIRDDCGGTVTLNKEEWEALKKCQE